MLSCHLLPMMRISRRSCLQQPDVVQGQFPTTSNVPRVEGQRFADPPFDHNTYLLIEVALRVFVIGTLATFGLVSNIINVIIFHRQGILSNSSTVSLTALALSDFFCCLFNVWGAVCRVLTRFVDVSNFKWDVHGFLIFSAVRPLDMFTQITCWVTVFTTFERLIGVTFPFKVKALFTPKRSLAAMTCIFTTTFILYIPNSFEEIPVNKINPRNNATVIGWDKSGLRSPNIRRVFFYMSPVILRFSSIIAVLLCNIIIFWKVYLSQKFRKSTVLIKSTTTTTTETEASTEPGTTAKKTREAAPTITRNSSQNQSYSNQEECKGVNYQKSNKPQPKDRISNSKEMRLLRMITVISVVFVTCYVMNTVYVIVYYVIWKWGVDYHAYVDHIAWLVVTLFQIINSSTNIFIYYLMSSRFKEDFQVLCKRKKV